LFSELAFEVFLCLYFRVTRRFMLRMQRELNTKYLKLSRYCCGQWSNYMDKYVRTGTSGL